MGLALHTDLYELNMAASYLRRGMEQEATFSLFVRNLPAQRGFLVAAGLEPCLDFLERFRFDEEDLAYLRDGLGFAPDMVERFGDVRFTGQVWAVPEGRIVFADEPLIEVTAPIAIAQLVETYLLNVVTFQTTIASKAARCRLAARDRQIIDFAFRRTQGADAAMAVARTTAMVGFSASSNVEAARRYGLRVSGTMAHSYIESFPSEAEAFRAFAEDFPDRTTFLVDTYDTLNGVRTAIEVIHELGLVGNLAVRLDSGELETLSRQVRVLLDRAGLPDVRIFASGGLDELEVDRLVQAGAPIDAFGVGTRVGVSADAPYLDSVYKLVEFDGRPVLKLSEDKATEPGAKQVWRGMREDDEDVLSLRDEQGPPHREPLLRPVMRDGRRLDPDPSITQTHRHFDADLARTPTKAKRLLHPEHVVVGRSDGLRALTDRTRESLATP
ncbi:MAG: nicotinate phosphoribosyltransferase [Actinomycetota bacterium]